EHAIDLASADPNWNEIRGSAISMIFQEPMSSLNPVMKVGKQLAETLMQHNRISSAESKAQAISWLEKVRLPDPAKTYGKYPHQLSGGQKQRIMIAMAMCNNPALLIADEPTTALDVTVQLEIINLMLALQKETGTAMLFITHDLALAAAIADEVLVMFNGKAMEYGVMREVLADPTHAYTRALLECRPSPSHKGKPLPSVSDIMQKDGSDTSDPIVPEKHAASVPGKTILKVENLRVWFSEEENWLGKSTRYFRAVEDVSFEIREGEILGLVGESGCGKSSLSKSLIGLLPVHEGQILFNGEDLAKIDNECWVRVRRDIQMIFQDPYASLNPRLTVGQLIMEPLKVHKIVPAAETRKEALRLLTAVQLPADAFYRYPHEFSGGQRQRVNIARALAMRPKLIICDESVSALDVSVQAQILNLLKELQQEFSLSYLFISHNLGVVHYISDRVMVMQAGSIVEEGRATDVLFHPREDYTKKLIASEPGVWFDQQGPGQRSTP
ncbi:MAG: ABC transporter ATP-binding protein, partial [Sphingobacteriales bacterium]